MSDHKTLSDRASDGSVLKVVDLMPDLKAHLTAAALQMFDSEHPHVGPGMQFFGRTYEKNDLASITDFANRLNMLADIFISDLGESAVVTGALCTPMGVPLHSGRILFTAYLNICGTGHHDDREAIRRYVNERTRRFLVSAPEGDCPPNSEEL